MKRTTWMRTAAAAVLAVAAGGGCMATESGAAMRADQAERRYTPEEEMAAWQAVANPGPEHQKMAEHVGEWIVLSKMWMDPAAPPEESTGSASIRMIHDGRFQQMDYQGSMMGQSFRGLGLTGFDLLDRKYVGTWCDSMGTMMMVSEGTADATGNVVTMTSSMKDPLGRMNRMRQVTTHGDADHFTFEMWSACGSKPEAKVMELQFTRKK